MRMGLEQADEISKMIDSKTRKDNISMQMLFPCLQIRQELVRQFPEFGFVNTYLTWDKAHYSYPVMYVVFQTEFTLPFYLFTLQMERSSNFIETIDVPNTVVLVYRIPKKFEPDFYRFLDGRYSAYSPEFRSCFLMTKFVLDSEGRLVKDQRGKYLTEYTSHYHIFNRTKDLKQRWADRLGTIIPKGMELYDRCDLDKETLLL